MRRARKGISSRCDPCHRGVSRYNFHGKRETPGARMRRTLLDRLRGLRPGSAKPDLPPVYLKPGQHIDALPQFATKLHLRQQIPLPNGAEIHSWYGGKPRMPEAVAWPRFRGEPMLFLAQLECSKFPEDLWVICLRMFSFGYLMQKLNLYYCIL